ncbi:MAG: TolC family protein [Comamonadaceae bacterium]|nr:TolC family protein [Comamonadaceae bacterium]
MDQLLTSAASRPRMRAIDHREQAARNQRSGARSSLPDVTIGLGSGS